MLNDVKYFIEMGFAVHVLGERSKSPVEPKWSTAKVYSFEELSAQHRKWTQGKGNLGVRLGEPSRIGDRYLHAIDLDIRDHDLEEEAVATLRRLLRGYKLFRFWTVRSGSGGASRHYYFLTDQPFATHNLARSDEMVVIDGRKRRAWEIDLLGTGKQIVLPPSIHDETGREYTWLVEPDFDFPVIVDSDHISDLINDDSDYDPVDNDEPMGLSWEEAEDMLERLEDMKHDHQTWRDVGMALKHEFGDEGWSLFDRWSKNGTNYNRRDNKYQWDRFENDRRKKITMRTISMVSREAEMAEIIADLEDGDVIRQEVRQAERAKPKAEVKPKVKSDDLDDDWRPGDPDMSLIVDSIVKAPAFPLEIFPAPVANRLNALSDAMTVPLDFIVAGFLGATSTAIGNRRIVRVNRTFTQPLVFWGLAIGGPSVKKSPGINYFRNTLAEIEKTVMVAYRGAKEAWDKKVAAINIGRKQLDAIRAKSEEQFDADDYPDNLQYPPKPIRRDILIENVTPEGIVSVMSTNPYGLGLFSEELSQTLENFDKFGGRPFFLKAYDASFEKVIRVKYGDEPITIERAFIAVAAAVQPEVLASITSAEQSKDDGLSARFAPFWPDYVHMPLRDEEIDVGDWARPILENLLQLETRQPGQPEELVFTEEARLHYNEWSNARELAELGVNARLGGILGKAGGQVVRMAAMLELITWAYGNDGFDSVDVPKEVSLDNLKRAIRYREDYLKPMQMRLFQRSVESEEMMNARALANWVVENDADEFNFKAIRRGIGLKGMGRGRENDVLNDATNQLATFGWVQIVERAEGKKGRPVKRFMVNPRVHELLKIKKGKR